MVKLKKKGKRAITISVQVTVISRRKERCVIGKGHLGGLWTFFQFHMI